MEAPNNRSGEQGNITDLGPVVMVGSRIHGHTNLTDRDDFDKEGAIDLFLLPSMPSNTYLGIHLNQKPRVITI